jgi:hypothetical protein
VQSNGLGHNSKYGEEEVKMKKLLVVLPLALLLVALALTVVGAAMDDDDPKLCVNGKWLLVNAAHVSGIRVTVPEDARFGNQQQGGCTTPGPNVPLITAVRERGERHWMRVWVDGAQATTPTVTVSYGAATQVKRNNSHGNLNFVFLVK